MMCQLGILSRRGGRAERCIGAAAPVALRRGSDGRKHRDPLGLGGGPSLGRKSCPLRDAGSRLSRDGTGSSTTSARAGGGGPHSRPPRSDRGCLSVTDFGVL